MEQKVKNEGILFYTLCLTLFFVLIEVSFFIQSNKAYLSDFTFVSKNLNLPLSILPGIIYFVFVQFLLHIAFWAINYFICLANIKYFQIKSNFKISLTIVIYLLSLLFILVVNTYFYPNSKFAELMEIILVNAGVCFIVLSLCTLSYGFFVLVALIELIIFFKKIIFTFKKSAFFIAFSIFIIFNFLHSTSSAPPLITKNKLPNIIIIGVDSLRPDFLSYFGSENQTPFLDALLKQSVVFSEALTPLARTFPSWVSILTGEYPRKTQVRFNLAEQKQLNFTQSLPAILKQHGYETFFATDETRFSNIDKNLGFDHMISPPMGLNDFLLGTFNDFPLSNLIVNTFLGPYLFPYSYANRPVYYTYNPNSFLKLVQPFLAATHTNPVFFAIHFCLPHFPYLWAELSENKFNIVERYEQSVMRVDQQVAGLFNLLQSYHLLDHTIVILLSDHGEALELNGDRVTDPALFALRNQPIPKFYPPSLDAETVNQSAGHGTDVLGLPQYHTLLAFKFYGIEPAYQGLYSGTVSLLDIKPTILQFLSIHARAQDGVSLKPVMEGKAPLPKRHLFLESDYSPAAIRTVYPETQQVLLEGLELFQINAASMRLTVKPAMGQMIIRSKQYADIYGDWMLALYPQNKALRLPILVNLRTGEWTDNLSSPLALASPYAEMLISLRNFYGNEIGKVQNVT